ncbi:DUF6538 domain-containing protein [Mesorhizobium argentiipisi]|uniref:DUF6538 domain-containing protein n=1 Tax=Mesorhizobium argentiipisi TaxID=3015175 RepID=UPI0039F5F451
MVSPIASFSFGRKEVNRTLGTKDPEEAKRKYAEVLEEFEADCSGIRLGAAHSGWVHSHPQVRSPSTADGLFALFRQGRCATAQDALHRPRGSLETAASSSSSLIPA